MMRRIFGRAHRLLKEAGRHRGATLRHDAEFREKDIELVGIKGTQMPTPTCGERMLSLGINDDDTSFAAARNGSGK
jgi:hypothetical protein